MSSWKTISRASLVAVLLAGTAAAQDPIEVERLDALDPLEVSLPGAALSGRLWEGTGRDMAEAVLNRLPGVDGDGYGSEALAETARRVLVSGGHPPAGGRGDAGLARLRTERVLVAAGADDAFDLLERTPGVNRMPGLARWHAELGFATGQPDRACRTANALLEQRDTAYWLRVRAFCLALSGQGAAAELTAELARSQAEDAGFDARLYAITLDTPLADDAPAADSGLEWAMEHYLAGGDAAMPALAADAPAWLGRVVHEAGDRHREPAADPAAAFAEAETLTGRERHHALEAVLAQGRDRELAGGALGLLLADTGGGNRFIHVARHHGREIETLPVTAATLEHGYEIALAALVVGNVDAARRWRNALVDGPPRPDPVVMVPAGLVGEGKPGDGTMLPVVPEPDWTPPGPRRMVALDMAIAIAADRLRGGEFEAIQGAWFEGHGAAVVPDILALSRLGAPAPADLRPALLDARPAAGTGGLAALDMAVRAGAHAEAALLAISVLNTPETGSDADAYSRAIAALDAVGLRRAALSLLLERAVKRAL